MPSETGRQPTPITGRSVGASSGQELRRAAGDEVHIRSVALDPLGSCWTRALLLAAEAAWLAVVVEIVVEETSHGFVGHRIYRRDRRITAPELGAA